MSRFTFEGSGGRRPTRGRRAGGGASEHRGIVPRTVLELLLAASVLVCLTGAALARTHSGPTLLFFVLIKPHLAYGVAFIVLGLWYVASHTRRLGARWWFAALLVVWTASLFGLYFVEVPTLPATLINMVGGSALALVLWAASPRRGASASWSSASLLMLVVGGLIATGYVMAMPFNSQRGEFYRWTHLVLAIALAPAIVVHIRMRRTPAAKRFRPRWGWYPAVMLAAVVNTWVGRARLERLEVATPSSADASVVSAASIRVEPTAIVVTTPIADDLIEPPSSCGLSQCHVGPYRQWRGSLHRFSATTIPFLRAVEALREREGEGADARCATCHNPLAVVTGAYSRGDRDAVERFARRGVDCVACHLRAGPMAASGPHDAFYRVKHDTPFPWTQDGDPLLPLRREYIELDTFFHHRKFLDPYLYESAMCGACHAETVVLANHERIVVFDQSAAHRRSKLPEQGITCHKCHLMLDAYARLEEKSMHARGDHRFPGIALDLPAMLPSDAAAGDDELAVDIRETADFLGEWLQGRARLSDYEREYLRLTRDPMLVVFEDMFENRPLLAMQASLQVTPTAWKIEVGTTNAKIGHDFPSGPLDLVQAWLEVRLVSAVGKERVLVGDDPLTGEIDPRAPRIGGRVLDELGQPIREHDISSARSVTARLIAYGETIRDSIEIEAPPADKGQTIRLAWRYRRLAPEFSRWAWKDDRRVLPSHVLASFDVPVSSGAAASNHSGGR